MQFKKKGSLTACYDEENNFYSAAVRGWGVSLYEISRETFESLDSLSVDEAKEAVYRGRRLYTEVIDSCGPPYTVVLDEDYGKLCPWFSSDPAGPELPREIVDAAVEILECEKDNREQRKQKCERRNKKKPD